MKYDVAWLTEAEDALAEIWLQASNPLSVTQAQARIDNLLSRDPAGNGRHLHEGLYQIVDPPLTVFYYLDSESRQVQVAQVWHTPS
jgi:hypothetical protein